MRRALGKGLTQLIGEQFDGTPNEVALEDIVPNQRQPRTIFDEAALEELAASIREYGVLQPLLVKPLTESTFELIAGERRLRASKLAGLKTVPVLVRSANPQGSLELALIENVQREDINALECARAYRRLIDEFGLTQEQVADRVGKGRTTIANTIRLLKLPRKIQDGLDAGRITEGHARALLAFETEPQQLAVYDQIIERGLTVREVERAARPKPTPAPRVRPEPVTGDDGQLQSALSEHFATPVRIQRGETGSKLVIEFYGDEDLDRILEAMNFRLGS